ncbi:anaerobic carbon-monoxide dehydrogenase catalytic subunit [Acetohalobium arabaticum]|uniref:Carbon monoxide dehydrogenase n=1 Tax=Acetohalobium arabaticum (strain ATCC 49924 / DSM 5501 / Z-7288) TaxID=574087 RepID=D9QQM7_ACEAZ|nr:anaerobic carbon-monoxide dehydrogenase catalytic subunit [Acetohalobium arabaticum]ADL12818.1 carbon-monoxide dehydrogenase, catalytic subunit [Acetohalobium arabaticum DSM 5501]
MVFEKETIDPAAQEMLQVAEEEGRETTWDLREQMEPQCGFGDTGVCCNICLQGPCRVNPNYNEKGNQKGICGARDYTIVARNLVRHTVGGTSSHSGHARHVAELFREVAEGHVDSYEVKDKEKLMKVADKLEIETEDRETNEIAKEVAEEAIGNFIGFHGEELSWLEPMVPESRYQIFNECNIIPTGINDAINEAMHRTAMGVDSDPLNLIFGNLQTALADFTGCTIGTDLSDIIFGTPEVVESEANLGVLDEDAVNVIVHGHEPVLSEKVVAAAKKLEDEAKEAGAENGINVAGICCTGNELLMRQGVPLATNFASQELAIMTGAVDAMVVDIQCIMPSIQSVANCYHTEIITTIPFSKISGAKHIEFNDSTADQDAEEIVRTAIEAYKERPKEINIPDYKSKLMAGFSFEEIENILSQVNEDDPLSVINDAIDEGDIKGICLFAGCNNTKVTHDKNHTEVAKGLVENDVLCVATGCVANALGKAGFMLPEAVEEYAGEGLKRFFSKLNEELGKELPLIWHMGSCVDNSRLIEFVTALANHKGVDIGEYPIVASAPEPMHEKAVSIGSWCVTIGLTTHVGVLPQITGSRLVTEVATKVAKDVYDGYFILESDPEAAVEELVAELDERTWVQDMKAKVLASDKYTTERY